VIALLGRGVSPRLAWVASGMAGMAAALVLAMWTPPDDARFAVCAVRRLAHAACPGCGLTRAIAALAHGNVPAALALHPLAPAIVLQALGGWIAWGAALLAGRPRVPARAITLVLVANLVALLAVWAARLATGTLPH
jgi:hypothetical protein